ncbi:putative polysaccharide deacetylase [Paramyrothecium foliicola]|nr:putative polysaccharide deacetylase [Paramyrothecium foliicola]
MVLALAAAAALFTQASATAVDLTKRQAVSTNGRCGNGFGTVCPAGYCCSSARKCYGLTRMFSYCGQGYLYCSAPSCQIDYGPACDANVRPNGPDTANTPRPLIGSIPYGRGIYHCEEFGDIALTYDDGPYEYTKDLLDMLKSYNAKATFFVTGRNLGKGAINDPSTPWPALIRRMIADGHQVASHTWSHQRLTTLSEPKFRNQMLYLETALSDLLGFFPTYMRPPYSASNATTDGWLRDLGYHVTYFNLDTEGYLHDDPSQIQQSKDIWDANVEGRNPANNKWLQIEHDPVYQSVYNLTGYMLESLFRNGFRSVTVGECLKDPQANWYRSPVAGGTPSSATRVATSTVAAQTYPPTTDGRCGPTYGTGCDQEPTDKCCSQYGWCGGSDLHCYSGCQFGFGLCKTGVPPGSSVNPPRVSTSSVAVQSASSARSSTASRVSSSVAPVNTYPISRNGRCGPAYNSTTCIQEPGATCCSKYGWCGANADYCGTGCQRGFGNCN